MPSWNIFEIGILCRFKTCVILKHASAWRYTNFAISKADNNGVFLTHWIWSSPTFITEKQTNEQTNAIAWAYFWCPCTGLCFKTWHLTAHNWQKWKRVFLTCPCHKIYRVESVGLKCSNYTWKIMIAANMWNLGQFREKLIFCQ